MAYSRSIALARNASTVLPLTERISLRTSAHFGPLGIVVCAGTRGLRMRSAVPVAHQPWLSAYAKKDRSAWHCVARVAAVHPSVRFRRTNAFASSPVS